MTPSFKLTDLSELPDAAAKKRMEYFDSLPESLRRIADSYGVNATLNAAKIYGNNAELIEAHLKSRGVVR